MPFLPNQAGFFHIIAHDHVHLKTGEIEVPTTNRFRANMAVIWVQDLNGSSNSEWSCKTFYASLQKTPGSH